jgi:hypothetical protein
MTRHPYRLTDNNIAVCRSCSEPAVLTCSICQTPYCADHLLVDGVCADCELSLSGSSSVARELRHGLAFIAAAIAAVAAFASFGLDATLLAIAAAPMAYGSVITTALAGGRIRNWLKKRPTRRENLQLAQINIAQATEEDEAPRTVGFRRERSRMLGSVADKCMRGTWGA